MSEIREYVPSWQRAAAAAPAAGSTAPPAASTPAPATSAASAAPYVPKSASVGRPAEPVLAPPPPHTDPKPKASGISVTNTTNNATSTFHDPAKMAVSPYTAYATPKAAPRTPSATVSPMIAKRIPTRMHSTPVQSSMNPTAKEFVPSGLAGGLEALPMSTADMNNPTAKTAAPYRPPERRTMLRRSANSSPAMPKAKNILEGKTEEEIRAISQKSKLNTTAAAYSFNPNTSRTMARVVLPPSPLSLQHSGPAGEQSSTTMQLDEVWCLFYLPLHGEHIKEETYNPTLVFRIDSVPTFWKVVNNIPIPTKLPYCTLYMFRDGIDPRWEDAANRDGGIVRLKINHNRAKTFNTLSPTQDRVEKASDSNVNEAWELLMCRTIGDSWSPEVRDTVNGIALKIRERSYIIEVWVTKSTPGITSDLSQLLHGTLGSVFAVNYYSHASMQERSHQLEIKAKQQQQQIAQSNKNSKNNKKY